MYFDRCDVISSHTNEFCAISKELLNLTIEPTVTRQSCNTNFLLQETANTTVTVYNSAGLRQKEIFSGILQKGSHTMSIALSGLPAGVYFLTLQTQERSETVKFIIAR